VGGMEDRPLALKSVFMKKHLLITIALTVTLCLKARGIAAQDGTVPVGWVDSLHSNILGETRTLFISHPEGIRPDSLTGKRYPVIYLLDARTHFAPVSAMVSFLSSWAGSHMLPEMIVVGIGNTDRLRDMTPTHFVPSFSDSTQMATSGGADHFLDFMEKELVPHIEQRYGGATHRTLIGHSLGGLLALHAFLHRPSLFRQILAIDPSLWWEHGRLNDEAAAMTSPDGVEISIYLAVANTIGPNQLLSEVSQDTSSDVEHIREILRFRDIMVSKEDDQVDITWKYYPDDTHGSAPLISEYDGLRHLFSWYSTQTVEDYVIDTSYSASMLIQLINEHFAEVSRNLGYTMLPPEPMVNNLAYGCLEMGWREKALALFQLNVWNYPGNANVHDSLGDYYSRQGDADNATRSYEKALTLFENPVTRQKLEALKKSKEK